MRAKTVLARLGMGLVVLISCAALVWIALDALTA